MAAAHCHVPQFPTMTRKAAAHLSVCSTSAKGPVTKSGLRANIVDRFEDGYGVQRAFDRWAANAAPGFDGCSIWNSNPIENIVHQCAHRALSRERKTIRFPAVFRFGKRSAVTSCCPGSKKRPGNRSVTIRADLFSYSDAGAEVACAVAFGLPLEFSGSS